MTCHLSASIQKKLVPAAKAFSPEPGFKTATSTRSSSPDPGFKTALVTEPSQEVEEVEADIFFLAVFELKPPKKSKSLLKQTPEASARLKNLEVDLAKDFREEELKFIKELRFPLPINFPTLTDEQLRNN